jgi:AAHS family 4-hydroxybenzoate transporter-like MFS transporter
MADQIANVTEIIDRRKLGPFQKRVALLCGIIVFMEGFNTQSVGYIAPAIAQTFHLKPADLGLFFSLGLFGLLLGALFVAPLADRFGRRPVLLACVPLLGICSLLTAASPSVPVLDTLRFLTGLAVGGALPNTIALTSEYSPHRRRSVMVALMFTGFILGSIVVGLSAAPLVPAFGWQSIFLLGGTLTLLLTPVLYFALPESVRFLVLRGAPSDAVAALLRRFDPTLQIARNTRFIAGEEASSGASVAALFREGRARRTVLLWIITFMSLFDLYLMANWLPTQMRALGFPIQTAILVGTVLQIGGLFGTIFGWLGDRIGANIALALAYVVGAICVSCIGLVGHNQTLVMLAVLGSGFGILGGQTLTNSVSAISYPTEIRSTGVGWATGIGRVGSIVGPGMAGILLQLDIAAQNIFFLAVIPALIASLAAASMGRVQTSFPVGEKAAI